MFFEVRILRITEGVRPKRSGAFRNRSFFRLVKYVPRATLLFQRVAHSAAGVSRRMYFTSQRGRPSEVDRSLSEPSIFFQTLFLLPTEQSRAALQA